MKRGVMKKIIIIGLSLFLGTQAFAFGMNTTGSASVEENHIQGEFEVNIPHRDCVATLEYAPVCARIQGEEAKTFSNGGHAKCAGASIIHAGPCDHGKEKDENHEKAHVGFGMNFAGKGMMAKHVQGVNAKAGLKFNKKQGLKLHMGTEGQEGLVPTLPELPTYPYTAEKCKAFLDQYHCQEGTMTSEGLVDCNPVYRRTAVRCQAFLDGQEDPFGGNYGAGIAVNPALDSEGEFSAQMGMRGKGKGLGFMKVNAIAKERAQMNGIEKFLDPKLIEKEIKEKGKVEMVEKVELKKVGDKAIYEVKAKKKGKFLGLFDVQMEVEASVDAENGKVLETKMPWYAFLIF